VRRSGIHYIFLVVPSGRLKLESVPGECRAEVDRRAFAGAASSGHDARHDDWSFRDQYEARGTVRSGRDSDLTGSFGQGSPYGTAHAGPAHDRSGEKPWPIGRASPSSAQRFYPAEEAEQPAEAPYALLPAEARSAVPALGRAGPTDATWRVFNGALPRNVITVGPGFQVFRCAEGHRSASLGGRFDAAARGASPRRHCATGGRAAAVWKAQPRSPVSTNRSALLGICNVFQTFALTILFSWLWSVGPAQILTSISRTED
jgi:hypothetical protein